MPDNDEIPPVTAGGIYVCGDETAVFYMKE